MTEAMNLDQAATLDESLYSRQLSVPPLPLSPRRRPSHRILIIIERRPSPHGGSHAILLGRLTGTHATVDEGALASWSSASQEEERPAS